LSSTPDLRARLAARLEPLARPPAPPGALVPAAVLVGFVQRAAGPSVILTRRSDALRSHTGQVALPGGRSEAGEAPWETALREAHEEIGLEPALVEVLGLSGSYHTVTDFLVTPVVGLVDAGFAPAANPDEVADIFETPFDFLLDPASWEERHVRRDGKLRRYWAAEWDGRTIWGATAAILRDLGERLCGAAVA
jgi:8-oxo-dGTP pyrophosphatase MutT (NUDIX family)